MQYHYRTEDNSKKDAKRDGGARREYKGNQIKTKFKMKIDKIDIIATIVRIY